jgi:hypothetical protein
MSGSGMNGIPGANAMGDTLAFVQNLWGSMKVPGMAMPSMSPEEIDKQIADLKAVESWLQMNMNMLRGSIQALEVQSATLSALRSMSETFAQAASGAAPADGKPAFESPFTFQPAAAAAAAAEPSAEAGAMPDPAAMAAQFANPTAWWTAMQDQFQQAVSQAVAPAAKSSAKRARKTASKSAATPKKPATSRSKGRSGG